MVRVVRFHGVDHAQIVDNRAGMRKKFAHLRAALAAWLEFPIGLFEKPLELAEFALPIIDRDRFAMVGKELGLMIEGIDVRNAAGHVQKDDPLRFGGKMRLPRRERV